MHRASWPNAFATYQGSGIKRDLSQAETLLILRTAQLSAARRGGYP